MTCAFTMRELESAIQKSKEGRAMGSDGIPAEYLKGEAGKVARQVLLVFMNKCLTDGEVPAGKKDVTITILFKKGDPRLTTNYRGISLISHEGKILERMLSVRLMAYMKTVTNAIPDSQMGFMVGRGTTDAIIMSRLLTSMCLDRKGDLYKVFVDLTKAYDRVHRGTMWEVLRRRGVPEAMVKIIASLHEGAMAAIKLGKEVSFQGEVPVHKHPKLALSECCTHGAVSSLDLVDHGASIILDAA
jgi:hypothetical protein